jgi:cysteine-rich repeat protein
VPSQFDLASDDGVTWAGSFPEQDAGNVIYYTADARFDDGSLRSYPDNPADPYYQLFTGGSAPLWCEWMDVEPEWPQSANGSLAWEWATPQADPTTRDPDAAFSGDHVLGMNIGGAGNYRFNLVSTIDAPAVDVSAFETVRLQYRRWLTVEDSSFDLATIEANGQEVWRNTSSMTGTLDHIDREWRFHDIDVTPYVADGSMQIRWTLTSDATKQLGGWTLDDVCIVGLRKIPRCGDGDRDVGEQCDDGNTESDDGCSATCVDEVTAGGGGCCSATRDARGAWLLALLVAMGIYRRRRASSLVPSVSVSERMPQ